MNIAIIGAGAIGGAVAEGLLKSGYDHVILSNPTEAKLRRYIEMGASVTTDNQLAIEDADVVIVAVKPWLVEQVLKPLDTSGKTVVSLAAGIPSEKLLQWIAPDADLWLAIPNIAASQLLSMTFLVGIRNEYHADVRSLFDAVGLTIECKEEVLPAGTTLGSCGIAYIMRYVRAATEGGVELGFRAPDAQRIIMQVMMGAVKLLETTGLHPEQFVDQVATPGGLSIRGLNEMEHAGFTSAVIRGLKASM